MELSNFWDMASALIVLGGTALATLLRSGVRDIGETVMAIAGLARPKFDLAKARSEIAGQVHAIRRDGIRLAEPAQSDDAETAEAADALAYRGDVQAAMQAHDRHAEKRDKRRIAALATLMQMGELAPIFGLAGTLLALARLPAGGLLAEDLLGAVSTAVLSTLYGLLLAHLVVFPLARKIERRGDQEEQDRAALMGWLHEQLHPGATEPTLRSIGPEEAA